jgi:hypothetical protein
LTDTLFCQHISKSLVKWPTNFFLCQVDKLPVGEMFFDETTLTASTYRLVSEIGDEAGEDDLSPIL